MRRKTVLCLGTFDGVHRGHQKLLSEARKYADEHGCSLIVHTFDSIPADKINGSRSVLLTSLTEREYWLKHFGADEMITTPFDEHVRNMDGCDFLDGLVKSIPCACIVAGEDHRFGKGCAFGSGELKDYCCAAGMDCIIVETYRMKDGSKLSSTGIRELINAGKTDEAEALLGHRMGIPQPVENADT